MRFDPGNFTPERFRSEDVSRFRASMERDLEIAVNDAIPEVKFTYAYNTLLKAAITVLAQEGYRLKSRPGHHVRAIDSLAGILKNPDVAVMGHLMRNKRNMDLYDGGIVISGKEAGECLDFVKGVVRQVIHHLSTGT